MKKKKKLGFKSIKLVMAFLVAVVLFAYPNSSLNTSAHAATLKVTSGWMLKDGKWYFYENGVMKTGWLFYHAKWYYLDENGVMKTGWVQEQGKWYYIDPNGTMHTGWLTNKGKTYYLDGHGVAVMNNWKFVQSEWYYFDDSGVVVKGWKYISGSWYYFGTYDGVMIADNFVEGYYLQSNGKRSTAGNADVVTLVGTLKNSIDVGMTQDALKNMLGGQFVAGTDSEGYPYWVYYLKANSSGNYQIVNSSIDDNPYETLGSGKADVMLQVFWDQANKAFTVHIQYFDANHKFHDYLSTKYDYVYN